MTLTLDRIALEDVGAEPQRLAAAILAQIRYERGRVPIAAIAHALGITEIREDPLTNLEGCLITTAERASGSILLNKNSSRQRRKYSLAHEVGHFMNPYHDGDSGTRYSCSAADLRVFSAAPTDRARRHEIEANRFAIEILAPRARCKAIIGRDPDIAEIVAMKREFDISAEAAARRYAELHHGTVAIVFSKNRRMTYSARSKTCPLPSIVRGDVVPLPASPIDARHLTDMAGADAAFWFDRFKGELTLQTLFQSNGYALSLFHLIPDEEEDESEIEDACDRFERLNGRD
jgi:hypothetical protein